jgi:hypothetical protein
VGADCRRQGPTTLSDDASDPMSVHDVETVEVLEMGERVATRGDGAA